MMVGTMNYFWLWLLIALLGVSLSPVSASAAEPTQPSDAATTRDTTAPDASKTDASNPDATKVEAETKTVENPLDPTAKLQRLAPEYDVWLDAKNKQVVMEGEVCLREGVLEMFACLKGTKEHESVVAVKTKAFVVHAGLLALGAKSGTPVKFRPEYVPATGPEVDVFVFWRDEEGKLKKAKAQDWVRDLSTKKAMKHPWVFSGSIFSTNPETGQEVYGAEQGYLICVSNFSTAMLDLPVESSDKADGLLFEAFTENIPPRGTKVTVVLVPKIEANPPKAKDEKPEATSK